MTHYLLISSDKEEPLRFFRELRMERNFRLSVLTRKKYAERYTSLADRIYEVDKLDDITRACQSMLEANQLEPVTAVIAPTEKSVLTGGFLRSYCAIQGPGTETALWMANKLAMKVKLSEGSIPVAPFKRIDRPEDIPAAAETLHWPLIVKPAMGSGRRGIQYIRSFDHFLDLHERKELEEIGSGVPWICEQCIEMEEYHCDALFQDGQVSFISVSKYFKPLLQVRSQTEGSFILHEEDPVYKRIVLLQKTVARHFRLVDGPAHMEVFHTPDGNLLVGEIALRVGGGGISGSILKKYGVNMWNESLLIAINEKREIQHRVEEGVFGWFTLPCPEGVIQEYTHPSELRQIPKVLDMELHYHQGDRVQEKNGSDFELATVYFNVDHEQEIAEVIEQVTAAFKVTMYEESAVVL